ncbi:Oidioi.mRNA.OKI2018_I69.chr2.g6469.t3.cds [Oikopleura dioica]|uniref:Oidioi.mRNA.OKI2018_I69.chr2.g6469.t3.cds n=1 Tax=Oikopleura dioica TaxID=34765 RepID=A0ABN7T3K5_OIKDI|nr:Oidioi.mRNA.OKI2018_I69.chr2.g6469.t3.cds [Oikopleura dioica]
MFELDFMGLAVLDPEFSRPMLPWVVREVIFRAEPHKVNLSVDNDQVKFQDANDSSPKVENSFQSDGYKIKDVYHPAHEPTSFAFVTREAASTPCSCYVFKNESVELVEQIVKKLKHEIGSGKRKRLGETSGESEVISYEVLLLNKTPIYTEKPSQDIIDNLIEQSKSQSATSTRPESANGTNEFSVDISTRNRGLISSDISTGVSDDRAGRSVIENKRKEFTRQRSHSYDTSNYKHENKTKIFQIGIDRLTVIDTDGPGVIDVKFTRVSRCVQGVKHPNSFGFVARDPRKRAQVNGNTGGQMEFYFYIFECFDEQTCEDIMGAIKQAFSASMRPITPLHTFHRLCVRLNHTQDLNQRLSLVSGVIEQISEGEKFYIDQKLKSLTPGSGTERLVFQVSVLREIFEVKNREMQLSMSSSKKVEQNSVISDERRTNGLSTPVRDLEEVSFESNDIDSVQHFSPAKSLRQQIYESVSSNATVSNSPRPSYKDKEIKKDLSTPDSIRNSLHQIEEENALLERIKQRISELEKMSPEEAGPLQQKLWADLGLDTVAAESKVNGAGEGRKNETVKLIPPGVIHAATSHAVPEEIRGEVWKFLIKQREHRHGVKFTSSFKTLINQLAPPGQAHSILIDLCRTFPKHRQFRESLAQSSGQKSLYNVLKAYCLLDDEVGYCQGLSFVVGLILIYLPAEEDAFAVLRHLMFECNMRRFYMPDMAALQEAMYQLSRLLAELEPTLYEFLESHCVTPVLYLTPWFLTLFASNFPMSFSSRVLDKWQSLTE